MKRRGFLTTMAGVGALASLAIAQNKRIDTAADASKQTASRPEWLKLTPPASGKIPVAFLLSEGATIIDFCGPWEVFQDVSVKGDAGAFSLYTVAETLEPITASAGMRITPSFTYENAPTPKVVVIPAQRTRSEATLNWLKKVSETSDVVMSVCTGAFLLAATGLLNGKKATTHHDFFDRFAQKYPQVELKRGLRFVENQKFSSAGGLTSGIDLALRVVERYFGREVAERTAFYMEYQSKSWMV